MSRRRGSATALNASEVVAARAMGQQYIPIWEYVKRYFGGSDFARWGKLQKLRVTRLANWLTVGLAFCANAFFEVFVEVLPHRAQRCIIVLQAADQQRAFQRSNDQLG